MMHDSNYMRQAVAEARKAMGKTHPNPAVGAVIVHDDKVVALGNTRPAGQDHAEIVALKAFQEAGLAADESTRLFVTMEPCCTHGRTPPCTDAIINSGIKSVIVGAKDPNPDHSGAGVEILKQAGLSVETDVLSEECEDINLIFNWVMENDQPLFAGKIATTIDGRIATRGGSSKWITGSLARQDVHAWRNYFPAIAVGAGTVIADDPSLTVRLEGEEQSCPVRFVFDRNLITFREGLRKVYNDDWKQRTIVVTNEIHRERVCELEKDLDIRFWMFEDTLASSGLSEFSDRCHREGIGGIYFEGGARLLSSIVQMKRLNYLFAYRAPKLLADQSALAPFMGMNPFSMKNAIRLDKVRHGQFGDDQLMRGFVVYPSG